MQKNNDLINSTASSTAFSSVVNTNFLSYFGYVDIIMSSASFTGNIEYISSVTYGINGCNSFKMPVRTKHSVDFFLYLYK